ncbi:hypothetical protein [Agromyces mangrovi Wang et al. 2018]|uniref:hypothetical protein n=1 Tax=Agromyces mangrovi TaxID=1858653 RepID=UPI002572AA25|nr:hypothetical protein [Agromyces mangrovi]BDZ63443.1 hypothetical protein GCM10025877_03810 [Agromyces mangrovi]
MSDSTPTTGDDQRDAEARAAHEREVEERLTDELAPEEQLLKGWLPEASPTDGPAPAP